MKKLFPIALILIVSHLSAQTVDSKIFGDIKARWLGPSVMSGRIACLDVVNNDTKKIYIGAAGGGVWKSEDFGTTFKPVFDKYTQSIGAITIDQSHPDKVWVGTGECWTRNSVSVGTGLYKTTDGGMNWKRTGLDSTERISRIVVNPKNSDEVYVAAPGHLFNDDANRGLYKTSDGGKSWTKILFVDNKTGCADVAMDPTDPNIIYASMWQFRRTPYSFSSGGTGSGLYKSVDGGKSWNKLSNGIPDSQLGRIAIAVSPVNPNIVYATIEYNQTALFKSSDKGEHWKRMGTNQSIVERPFYFSRLLADPVDSNIVYRGGLSMIVSRDGGNSFASVSGSAHGDQHDIWINPHNNSNLVMGTDGGVYLSFDQGSTWMFCRSLPVGQFYHVMYDMQDPYNVYGGLQDNLSWYGPSKNNTGGVRNKDWFPMTFGDGFWSFPDQSDDRYVYSEIQGGVCSRYDKATKTVKEIHPYPGATDPKFRFNWNAAFVWSPNNPHKLYLGGQFVFVSYDKGETWKKISSDLTTDNPKEQQQEKSGGVTSDNSSAENHCSIYTIAESPVDSNVIWVGTDDGNVQLTKDAGRTWTNVIVNAKDLPKELWVTSIDASTFDKGTAYITPDGHYWGDMKAYVYKTNDFGQSWMKINNDSIKGYCHVVRQDLKNQDLIFVGSEFGLYVSIDDGKNWNQLNYNNNIPNVAIRDIVIHSRDNDLILATHGRGIMIIDELGLSILRQLSNEVAQQKFYLFKTHQYILPVPGIDGVFGADDEFVGTNPNTDPVVAYYLKDKQLIGEFKVEVLDKNGGVINSSPAGKHKGVNIVSVPLRMKPPKCPPAPLIAGGATIGPDLPEGKYSIRIIHGKDTTLTSITIQQDKKSPYTADDRKMRWESMMKTYNLLNGFSYTVDCITTLRDQAKTLASKLPDKDKLKMQLQNLAHDLDTLHEHVVFTKPGLIVDQEARLREQLASLYGTIASFDGRPNNSAIERATTLTSKVNETEQTLQTTLNKYLPKINAALKAKGQQELVRETRGEFDKVQMVYHYVD